MLNLPRRAVILLILSVILPCAGMADPVRPCADLFDKTFRYGALIGDTYASTGVKFRTNRQLVEYMNEYGPEFYRDLQRLGKDSHWVDLGAGDGIALHTYLHRSDQLPYHVEMASEDEYKNLMKTSSEERAKVTGITYSSSPKAPQNSARFNLIGHGEYFEKMDLDGIEKADLITDFYGVLAYTSEPGAALTRALELLKDSGSIYLFLGQFDELQQSLVHLSSGGTVTFSQWVRRLPGLDVQLVHSDRWVSNNPPSGFALTRTSLKIRKKGDVAVKEIPHLTILNEKPHPKTGVPIREYRESN